MPARRVTNFFRDNRGTAVQRTALIAGSIALVCIVSANLADTATKRGLVPEIVWHHGSDVRQIAGRQIDYTPTGSIPSVSASTRLDPCTGKEK